MLYQVGLCMANKLMSEYLLFKKKWQSHSVSLHIFKLHSNQHSTPLIFPSKHQVQTFIPFIAIEVVSKRMEIVVLR